MNLSINFPKSILLLIHDVLKRVYTDSCIIRQANKLRFSPPTRKCRGRGTFSFFFLKQSGVYIQYPNNAWSLFFFFFTIENHCSSVIWWIVCGSLRVGSLLKQQCLSKGCGWGLCKVMSHFMDYASDFI